MFVKNVVVRHQLVHCKELDCDISEEVTENLRLPSVPNMIKAVINKIKQRPEQLCMMAWHSAARDHIIPGHCNTKHCAAGWVSAMFNPHYANNMRAKTFEDSAKDFAFRVLNPEDNERLNNMLSHIFYNTMANSKEICQELSEYLKAYKEEKELGQ